MSTPNQARSDDRRAAAPASDPTAAPADTSATAASAPDGALTDAQLDQVSGGYILQDVFISSVKPRPIQDRD